MNIIWKKDMEKLDIKEKDGVTWLSFPRLEQTGIVLQAFSTRLGGCSKGFLESMNLGFSRGDDPEAVMENYRRISRAVGFPLDSIVTSDQTHTTNLRVVGREDCGSGITRPRDFTDVDGLLTGERGVTLATFYADCVPLFFVDPVRRAIALSHSGWRGTVHRMGRVTVERMQKEFGTKPEDLMTAVGPSICQDCYEVSEDVIGEFAAEFAADSHRTLFYRKENGKYQLNLWEANRRVLLEAGVKDENIGMPGICTCCNPGLLFSHRASKGKRGNLGAFLMLK